MKKMVAQHLIFALVMCVASLVLSERGGTHSPQMVFASWRPEFQEMALEGTIPSWIDSSVAVPGLDNLFNPDKRMTAGPLEPGCDNEAYMQLISADQCPYCSGGLIFPSLTNPDGSDIFEHDVFEPSYQADGIQSPAPYGCRYIKLGYLVCSEKDLTEVPRLPPEIKAFEMNGTSVQSLKSSDFNGTALLIMKLNFNAISNISNYTFMDNGNLTQLSLEYNRITSIDPSMFIGLDSLEVLSLKGNQINLNQTGVRQSDCCAVDYLPQLVYLNLANNPLSVLLQDSFLMFRNSPIEELNLQSCNLGYIHQEALSPLRNLKHLDLFNNSDVIPLLDAMDFKPLARLTKLGLAANLKLQLPIKFIQSFNSTLIQLNLAANLLPELSPKILAFNLPNLTALVLSDCSIGTVIDDTFTKFPKLVALYLARNNLKKLSSTQLPPLLQTLSVRQNPPERAIGIQERFEFQLDRCNNLTSLTWLDMNSVNLDAVGASNVAGLSGLHYLQVRHAKINTIDHGVFSKLNELILLDLGENSLHQLPLNFSDGLGKLRVIFLDQCSLSFSAADPSPFASLVNLQQMFLNGNKPMEEFHPSLIENLMRLGVLDLSNNQLKSWKLGTTRYMSNQTSIDVSYNQITSFPSNIFDEFDHIGAVDFSYNNFFCNCDVEELRRLAEESNVTVLNWEDQSSYKCRNFSDPNQPEMNISDLNVDQLNCNMTPTISPEPAHPFNVLSIECSTIAVLLIFTGVISYWKWDRILQMWFLLRRRVTIKSMNLPSQSDAYNYDAFISFNEHDRDWVYTNLVPQLESNTTKIAEDTIAVDVDSVVFRLCLHDRDFMAGERITDNIIANISKSRKVVIVLSQAYVKSNWCQYELNLSQDRLAEEKRNDLVIILLEDAAKRSPSRRLRNLIRTRTYLAWTCDIEGQQLFWQRLRRVLHNA